MNKFVSLALGAAIAVIVLPIKTFAQSTVNDSADDFTCAASLAKKSFLVSSDQGDLLRGFGAAGYSEDGSTRASIVLETKTTVYFYTETSDESAALYSCDKTNGSVKALFQAHDIECSDLPSVAAAQVIYSSCPAQ
jgi:hypothetical protein